jgi:predicted TIM-barrel fold metal-dependent hydrolase
VHACPYRGVIDVSGNLIVVTTDSHIGPRLKDDLRAYCPKAYLEDYDEFLGAVEPYSNPFMIYKMFDEDAVDDSTASMGRKLSFAALKRNATAGHHDVRERLKDMDRDGVAAEVIYHGSQNGQCFPFMNPAGGTFNAFVFSPSGSRRDLELAAVGQRMYNTWLADQCSVEPERHVGLAHLPMWDIAAATRELEWAHGEGLRAVNFPAPKPGITPYDSLEWEPFWSACEARGMALCTHDGAGVDDVSVARPHSLLVSFLEGDLSRKFFPRMILGGIFERHPNLRLVLTEVQQPASSWWTQTGRWYDELWGTNRDRLSQQVPRPPSEYLASNIFLGQSYLHALPSEVAIAVRDGYAANFTWGSDYPHQEGVYRHPDPDETETRIQLGLRHAFSGAPAELARGMVGENAVSVFGLDQDRLALVAERIGAITPTQLGAPLDAVPEEWAILARSQTVFPEYHAANRPGPEPG